MQLSPSSVINLGSSKQKIGGNFVGVEVVVKGDNVGEVVGLVNVGLEVVGEDVIG